MITVGKKLDRGSCFSELTLISTRWDKEFCGSEQGYFPQVCDLTTSDIIFNPRHLHKLDPTQMTHSYICILCYSVTAESRGESNHGIGAWQTENTEWMLLNEQQAYTCTVWIQWLTDICPPVNAGVCTNNCQYQIGLNNSLILICCSPFSFFFIDTEIIHLSSESA